MKKLIKLHKVIFFKSTPEIQQAKFIEENKEVLNSPNKENKEYEYIDCAVAAVGLERFYKFTGLAAFDGIYARWCVFKGLKLDEKSSNMFYKLVGERLNKLKNRKYDEKHFRHIEV
jgi:hypothetical protein